MGVRRRSPDQGHLTMSPHTYAYAAHTSDSRELRQLYQLLAKGAGAGPQLYQL